MMNLEASRRLSKIMVSLGKDLLFSTSFPLPVLTRIGWASDFE
jgi:hypothetical protein